MSRSKKHVHSSLDRLNKQTKPLPVDLASSKYIIFSDHHRGRRDGADDFLSNEPTYLSALNYYHKENFNLILLGDVEEFWENPLGSVMKSYDEVLASEQQFHKEKRLHRIWGNHDDLWKVAGFFTKHLGELFPDIKVTESLKFQFYSDEKNLGEMLLVHGHQGTTFSERFAGISRFFVKHIWRHFQSLSKIPLSTPSNNIRLKSKHDMIMFDWANEKSKQIIVCGHTHQPVFMSFTHADFLELKIDRIENDLSSVQDEDQDLKASLIKAKQTLEMELQRIQKDYDSTNIPIQNHRKPCYFNSGCCSFGDGDITGLEIDRGRIRLIKWSLHNGKGRIVLEDNDLAKIFEACV